VSWAELAPGTLVAGRYRVGSVLGRGGMGVVYRAVQLPLERPVALKLLRAELLGDDKARARFEREARVASALPHPTAVAIHDFGDHEGTAYLAMELVEGVRRTRSIWRTSSPTCSPRRTASGSSTAISSPTT
jgi:serine/threonine-protein kinase